MGREWTKEQNDAITARGGSVLVSASAGSGKTSLLVERIIRRILDAEDLFSIDRILMVTFSKASAKEMKDRISLALASEIASNPKKRTVLTHQMMLLSSASISTIHSFFLDIISEYGEVAGVTYSIKTLDDNDAKVLCSSAAEEIITERYNSGDVVFLELADLICSGQDDAVLAELLTTIYKSIRAKPYYRQWIEKQIKNYLFTDFLSSCWGEYISRIMSQDIVQIVSALKKAQEQSVCEKKLKEAFYVILSGDIEVFKALLEDIAEKNFDKLKNDFRNAVLPTKTVIKCDNPDILCTIRSSRALAKNFLKSPLYSVLFLSAESFGKNKEKLSQISCYLYELILALDDRYSCLKRDRNAIDFSDMEQITLSILTQHDGESITPTKIAETVSERYEEIYIDEYQDTSEVQEEIFKSISRDNMFMVGDIKQSIYRFREADPEIFLRKQEEYADYNGTDFPAKIFLSKNFRSRKEVTDAVNFVFSRVMNKYSCKISYSSKEKLIAGAQYPENPLAVPEIMISDTKRGTGYSAFEQESMAIAQKIREMVDTHFPITVNGELVPCRYSDFCILLRSARSKAEPLMKELSKHNIPVKSDAVKVSFFDTDEITALLSILRTVNDPYDEISLISSAMGFCYGVSATEMTRVRLMYPDIPLYKAITEFSSDENCTNSLKQFVFDMQYFRLLSVNVSVYELVYTIYSKTELLAIAAYRCGDTGTVNLRLFSDYAKKFEADGYRGLHSFLFFIDKVIEKKVDFEGASDFTENANAVNVMTIHKSKGLEFPIVIVANCSGTYNDTDTRAAYVFDKSLGFAAKLYDSKSCILYSNPVMEATKIAVNYASHSEEMRLLYVALTRAKEKLIVSLNIDSATDKYSKLKKEYAEISENPGVYSRYATSYKSLILPIASCDDSSPYKITIVKPLTDSVTSDGHTEELKPMTSEDTDETNMLLTDRINGKYPYQAETVIKTKYTVSELLDLDYDKKSDYSSLLSTESDRLSADKIGTVYHSVIFHLDYSDTDIRSQLDRMVSCGFITQREREAVSEKIIENYLSSKTAERIRTSQKVYREYELMYSVPARYIGAESDEMVMIQGMLDCAFIEDGKAVIVDYKTNRIKELDELRKYTKQLEIYKKALEANLGIPVSECILYSLYLSFELYL